MSYNNKLHILVQSMSNVINFKVNYYTDQSQLNYSSLHIHYNHVHQCNNKSFLHALTKTLALY